jgi:hypothetical protein
MRRRIRVSISLAGRPGLLASFRFFPHPGIANTTLKKRFSFGLEVKEAKRKLLITLVRSPALKRTKGDAKAAKMEARAVSLV